MPTACRPASLLALLLLAAPAAAQTYTLAENPQANECFRVGLSMTLAGELRVRQGGRDVPMKLTADAAHDYTEKILQPTAEGTPAKSARHYETARSAVSVGGNRNTRALGETRRLIVAQRAPNRLLCYAPAGPLTRDEAELVGEHFDTLAVTGLLPGKAVAFDPADPAKAEAWKLPNAVVQALCQYEGLVSQEVAGRIIEVKDGQVAFQVAGKAVGIELGAQVKSTIEATCRYDILSRRLVAVEWRQSDDRDQGPASPASVAQSAVKVTRTVCAEPRELSGVALTSVPAGDPPAGLTQLAHREPKGRYSLLHARDWRLVGQTDDHLVMRLLDRGDFVAQVTVTVWKKAEPGKHMTPDEFKKAVLETPGWETEEVVEDGPVPSDGGRWAYRFCARGALDGVKVVQNFYAVADRSGAQVMFAFTMRPNHVATVGTRDVAFVNALVFEDK